MSKAVILLSGGLDSTYNLYAAFKSSLRVEIALALTFDYGQRAAKSERDSAEKICKRLGVVHQNLELSFFKMFTSTSLIRGDRSVPTGEDVDIHSSSQSQKTALAVWVPNRNGIFLNIAAGFAEGLGAEFVIAGFNREEAETFSDNSEDFMRALDQAFTYSTANKVKVLSYSSSLCKTEIVARAKDLAVPFEDVWPCYFSGPKVCGVCESCQRYRRALIENHVDLLR